MAGTRWTWKQSVSETRVDTRVWKRREFPGLGKACLATEDMTEGARRFEGRNKGARFGSRSDGGDESIGCSESDVADVGSDDGRGRNRVCRMVLGEF
jgi:hypothetical protein